MPSPGPLTCPLRACPPTERIRYATTLRDGGTVRCHHRHRRRLSCPGHRRAGHRRPGQAGPGRDRPGSGGTGHRRHLLGGAQRQADDLVSQLTLDEKISLVHGDTFGPPGFAGHVPGIPRLGIPDLYLADGPNGVADSSTGVTAFPVAEADAASFDTGLVQRYGAALGAEQIGKGHNVALSPTINILRVPYWGRAAETFGEDPYLTSQMAVAEVKGLQSQHVIATTKHFAGNNQETYRLGINPDDNNVNEYISQRALNEIYYPGFKAAVQQGGTGAVMCAYNQVNGEYSCQNGDLLASALKAAWNFDGFVVSDWFDATKDTVQAANAGLDMEMPLGTHFGDPLKQAIADGQVPLSRLNDMVRRILTAEIKVGLFDHPVANPPLANVSTPAHRQLGRPDRRAGERPAEERPGRAPIRRRRALGRRHRLRRR